MMGSDSQRCAVKGGRGVLVGLGPGEAVREGVGEGDACSCVGEASVLVMDGVVVISMAICCGPAPLQAAISTHIERNIKYMTDLKILGGCRGILSFIVFTMNYSIIHKR
jgi:hypothetical protein